MGESLPEELWGPDPSPEELAQIRRAEAAQARQRLAQVAAVSLGIEQAASRAGRSVDQVQAALDAGELVSVQGPAGPLVPSWQLRGGAGGGFVPGVAELARIFHRNAVTVTLWVLRPSPDLGRRTPAQALIEGETDKVVDIARTLTAKGW